MDSYVKSISVDVNAEENYTMVKAKQGDKINRKLAITLKKDGANFTPSGVSEIWFRVEKPDKNVVIVKSTDSGSPISVSENVYTVDLTEQCLTASGEAWCDIAFLDDSGNILSSAAFVMKIIPMPNGDSARSSSAWTDLQGAIDDAERFASILAFRVNDGYVQYSVDSETWINLMPSSSVGSPDSNTVPNRSEVSGETVTQALNWLKNNSGATSDDITNESTVDGQTVTDALDNLDADKAPLDSPAFTGTPTSPTPANTDNSTKVATTEFVQVKAENLKNTSVSIQTLYTGPTDLDSIIQYAITTAQSNNLFNKPFTFKVNYSGSGSTGYFDSSSLQVLCVFSSDQYGFGIMFSDNKKSIAGFIRSGGTNILYPVARKNLYYKNQTVSVTTNGQIMRIPASGTDRYITEDTVVLECDFGNPMYVGGSVDWESHSGYITFTGTCTSATTANVVLGEKYD